MKLINNELEGSECKKQQEMISAEVGQTNDGKRYD